MHPLFPRFVILISAGLLMYEIIKGEFSLSLKTPNFIDSIIIIVAICGLFLGISIPDPPISDSASTDTVTSRSEIAPPDRTRTEEESKNNGD